MTRGGECFNDALVKYKLDQCFKNRTGPAGRTGQTADRSDREPKAGRSGSTVRSDMQSNRSEPVGTGKTDEPAVYSNRRFDCNSVFFLKKNTKNDVVLF
jgi:hypothetical protein